MDTAAQTDVDVCVCLSNSILVYVGPVYVYTQRKTGDYLVEDHLLCDDSVARDW